MEKSHLGGAALDVTETEPLPSVDGVAPADGDCRYSVADHFPGSGQHGMDSGSYFPEDGLNR
nr:hypothetical protein [Pseudarthrobacter sp. NamE2]